MDEKQKTTKRKKKKPCYSCMTKKCLSKWQIEVLQQKGVPVFMLSVGHGWNHGQLILSIAAGRSNNDVLLHLQEAVRQMKIHISQSD
ncbi:MAG: hypothetical protein AAF990_28600 [Bacteroidota bacterium]